MTVIPNVEPLFANDQEKTTYKTITTEEVIEHFYPTHEAEQISALYDVNRPTRGQIEAVLDYLFESGHLEDFEVVEDLVDVDLEVDASLEDLTDDER